MPTQISQKTDDFYVLRLNPLAEVKATFASVCGGSVAGAATEISVNTVKFLAAGSSTIIALFAFAAMTYAIYETMEHNTMEKGQWQIKKMKRPTLNI